MKRTYTFSIYAFTDQEIEAICYLLKKRQSGLDFIDRRKVSKQVQDYALIYDILAWNGDKLVYAKGASWNVPINAIPVECLKRFVFPMLSESGVTGIDIVKDVRWSYLCIPCFVPDGPSQQAMGQVNEVLTRLHQVGYLKFYNFGDVWEIYTEVKQEVA